MTTRPTKSLKAPFLKRSFLTVTKLAFPHDSGVEHEDMGSSMVGHSHRWRLLNPYAFILIASICNLTDFLVGTMLFIDVANGREIIRVRGLNKNAWDGLASHHWPCSNRCGRYSIFDY
mmetsp:Transcript_14345/g.34756  ORF Transcript_14345/g.34756 Transcript_14345/m.34756 type:complete len:118 (+) Transcript_14345:35-388(+)